MRVPVRPAARQTFQAGPPGPAFRLHNRLPEAPPGDAARGMMLAVLLSSLFWMALAWAL
jgi:hypothetical protein